MDYTIRSLSLNINKILISITFLVVSVVIFIIFIEAITIENLYPAYADYLLPANFNFAAVADWGCSVNTNNTVSNIVLKSPELVLALGDFSYKPAVDCWFQRVDPVDDKMKIAIGNHDIDQVGKLINT